MQRLITGSLPKTSNTNFSNGKSESGTRFGLATHVARWANGSLDLGRGASPGWRPSATLAHPSLRRQSPSDSSADSSADSGGRWGRPFSSSASRSGFSGLAAVGGAGLTDTIGRLLRRPWCQCGWGSAWLLRDETMVEIAGARSSFLSPATLGLRAKFHSAGGSCQPPAGPTVAEHVMESERGGAVSEKLDGVGNHPPARATLLPSTQALFHSGEYRYPHPPHTRPRERPNLRHLWFLWAGDSTRSRFMRG